MKLLFERSVAGRRQTIFPDLDVPEATFDKALRYRPWQRVHDVGFRVLAEDAP